MAVQRWESSFSLEASYLEAVRSVVSPVQTLQVDALSVQVYESAADVALAASDMAEQTLRDAIEQKGEAAAIFATGRSQVRFLSYLTASDSIDWSQVTGFHLDEYLGIAAEHPTSFRHYLHEHLTSKVTLKQWHSLEGDSLLPLETCKTYEKALRQQPADLCCLGIGNNGHLAFNDPAVARFDDPDWVKLVRLDSQNRWQQVDSGNFGNIKDVPQYAFTLTLSAIQAANRSLCIAYGEGKANIIHETLTGNIGTHCPSSILRKLPQATLIVDLAAARLVV